MGKRVKAELISEGAGAKVRRLFPLSSLLDWDPFVLFDEFFVDPQAGFPRHPHRGFEAVTYMLEGSFHHEDNLGNMATVGSGGVMRFTAGKGIVHSEMPGSKEVSHGIQLWVNLPRSLKGIEAEYQQMEPDEVPEQQTERGVYRTIIGEGSSIIVKTPVIYSDIRLESREHVEPVLPKLYRGLVYVYKGRPLINGEQYRHGDGILLESDNTVLVDSGPEESSVLFIAGHPHNEPIIHNGSFID